MVQKVRHDGIDETDRIGAMAQIHAETCCKESKGRRGGPSLQRASDRIGRRAAMRLADEAAEQFRQAAQILTRITPLGSFRGDDAKSRRSSPR